MNKKQIQQLNEMRKNLPPGERKLSGSNKYINPIHKPQKKQKNLPEKIIK
ncbi:MAG: hypothetical protein ACOVNY_00195 [Chitinophagaceae bacterium]|jgi:hypothetical protein